MPKETLYGQKSDGTPIPLLLNNDGSVPTTGGGGGGGGGSDTQYTEETTQVTAIGTLALGKNGATVKAIQTDATGNIILSSTTPPIVKLDDGSGNAITSTAGALDVNLKTPATLPISSTDGSQLTIGAKADPTVTTLATSTTPYSLISLIKGLLTFLSRIPAQGSALSAASQPVVIASDQAAIPTTTTGISADTFPATGTITIQDTVSTSLT